MALWNTLTPEELPAKSAPDPLFWHQKLGLKMANPKPATDLNQPESWKSEWGRRGSTSDSIRPEILWQKFDHAHVEHLMDSNPQPSRGRSPDRITFPSIYTRTSSTSSLSSIDYHLSRANEEHSRSSSISAPGPASPFKLASEYHPDAIAGSIANFFLLPSTETQEWDTSAWTKSFQVKRGIQVKKCASDWR